MPAPESRERASALRDALVVAPAQIGRPASDQWLGLWRYSPARAEPAAVTVALRFEHSATVPIVVLVLVRVPIVVLVLVRVPMVVLSRAPMVVLVRVLGRVPMVVLGRVPMVSSSASASPSSS